MLSYCIIEEMHGALSFGNKDRIQRAQCNITPTHKEENKHSSVQLCVVSIIHLIAALKKADDNDRCCSALPVFEGLMRDYSNIQ